jgi:integrase
MAPRRGNGEGSICRRKNGAWQGALRLPDGRRKYVYGESREEVRRKLNTAIHALETGTLSDSRGIAVGEFLDKWLEEVVRPNVRPWTFAGYEVHVRLHLKPTIGTVPLDKLSPMHVQRLMNQKIAEGLRPKTIRYIRGTLRSALNHGVRWGLISRNAAALVASPRVEQYEIKPLTPVEARTLLQSLRGDRLEALYSVALTMGLRQGEALGLRWHDVDLELGYMRISKQLQRIDRRLQLVEPKTSRSRRSLAMPRAIVVGLREHQNRQEAERRLAGDRWMEGGFVFTTPEGKPLDGTAITKQFHRHLERAGLAQRRFHDLRHSCATLLLVQGVSPRVVMDVLGHSQIGLTMNTYSHVIPELRREAADRMDHLLGGLDDER